MDHPAQRIVALIAGSLANKTTFRTVYDDHGKKHYSMSAEIHPERIRVYERESHTDIIGTPQHDQYALYNNATHKHISLSLHEHHFSGYDFASSRHFEGEIHGNNVSLYDHQNSNRSHYALS
jgi:hypothetical protein